MPQKSEERKKERFRSFSVPFSSKLGKKNLFNIFLTFVKIPQEFLKKVGHRPI